MRTTDPEPTPMRPLGERAKATAPPTPPGAYQPVPGRPGIEQNARGELRTNLPLPKG